MDSGLGIGEEAFFRVTEGPYTGVNGLCVVRGICIVAGGPGYEVENKMSDLQGYRFRLPAENVESRLVFGPVRAFVAEMAEASKDEEWLAAVRV